MIEITGAFRVYSVSSDSVNGRSFYVREYVKKDEMFSFSYFIYHLYDTCRQIANINFERNFVRFFFERA